MNEHCRSNLPSSMALAAILGIGATAAWMLLVMLLIGLVMGSSVPLPRVLEAELPFGFFIILLLPSPALAAIELLFLTPLKLLGRAHFDLLDFGRTQVSAMVAYSVPLLVISLVSIALAKWSYRRQAQCSGRSAMAWAVFVFLMGVPGLVGFLLHRRWPTTEFCANCRKNSPRDRDACLHCGTEFPPPTLKGIEIFA